MAKQKMLINVYEEETRIALMEEGTLVGLHFQQTNRERTAGNIYRGVIVKVNPAFQAAFVDYGEKRNGFLSISDLNPALFKTERGGARSRIQTLLRSGQSLMVQVLKEGMREKGAALTTNLSLPGRYLVYTPNSDRSGVSRKIDNTSKRHELKDILTGLVGDDDGGVIIRTAGIDRPAQDLKRDLSALKKEWTAIQDRFGKLSGPGQIHQEPGSIVRVLRDYFTDDVEEVWVDSPEAYQEALAYIKSTLPKFQKRLKLYVGELTLFSAHNVEEQIEALASSRVALASGGSVVIESTEALVSIDVNSGRSNQESDIEDTALRTNQEAAREVARQLRLRNLGGLIVVDFIDMFQAKNRAKVVQTLTEALRYDKARTSIGSISQFGLLEMSRQRIDMELSLGLRHQCEVCNGTGSVPTQQAYANSLLRKIRLVAATHRYTEIHGELPMEHANYVLNHKRESLRDLELEFDIKIHLFGSPSLPSAHAVELSGRSAEGVDREQAAPAESRPAAPPLGEAGLAHRRRRRRGRGRGGETEASTPQEPLAAAGHEESAEDHMEAESFQEELEPDNRRTEAPFYVDELEESAEEGEAEGGEEVEDVTFVAEPDEEAQQPVGHAEDGDAEGGGAEDNGGPRVGRMISPGIPSGNEFGVVRFSSAHRIVDPDIELKPDPPRRPVSPFKRIGAAAPEGAQVYASAHLGAHGELAVVGIPMPPPPPTVPPTVRPTVPPTARPSLRSARPSHPSARPSLPSARPSRAVKVPVSEAESRASDGAVDEDAEPQEMPAASEASDATGPRRRPRRRGRGRGSKPAGTGASAAPLAAERIAPEEDLDDSIGNLKPSQTEPASGNAVAGAPGRPPRRRRGGRGRGRPAGSGSAPSDAV
jgi:ribonuclease E